MSVKQKQTERVLEYMEKHGGITQLEADTISVKRLASRIWDIRKLGYVIETERVTGKNQYGQKCWATRYKLGV